MPTAIALLDGQNLFHSVKAAFGHSYPNYDPKLLARSVCGLRGWDLIQTRFYTGVPRIKESPFWHGFWSAKLAHLNRRKDMFVYSRPLQYLVEDGRKIPREKGIDVRIAIDAISLAISRASDIILVFSQDQDLSEVAAKIREINGAREEAMVRIACAYPLNPRFPRGIDKTDWIPFDQALYDSCIDSQDYRPRSAAVPTP